MLGRKRKSGPLMSGLVLFYYIMLPGEKVGSHARGLGDMRAGSGLPGSPKSSRSW